MNTKEVVVYRVKDLVSNWLSLPFNSKEEAEEDLVRLRDRKGMQLWKTPPPTNYVVVKEETTVKHTVL